MRGVIFALGLYRRAHYILVFYLPEIDLLGAEHRAWSRDSRPTDESFRTNFVVFHRIDSDQSACAAETSFAVDSDRTRLRVSKVLLTPFNEAVYNVLGWR